MSFPHIRSDHRARVRTASVWLLAAAVSASACWSFRRVPKTTTTSVSPSETSETPLFTSRDGAPTSFVLSTSDAKTTRILVTREGMAKPAMFRAATEYLAQRFTIDVSDPNAGYLMTPWQATLSRDGVPELRYRTRVILRFLGDDWKQLAVRAEANWLKGEEWQVGYDAALLDSVSANLTQRLGRHP
jgi:hypothetical protein